LLRDWFQINSNKNCILVIPCLMEMRIPSPLFQGGFVGSRKRFRPTDRLLEGDAFGIVLKQRRQPAGDKLGRTSHVPVPRHPAVAATSGSSFNFEPRHQH